MKIGQLCVKIAGRDAGKKCVIIDEIDDTYVMIDGQTRRKKCNIKHLEPLDKIVKVKKNASNSDVVKVFKRLKIIVEEKKEAPKKEKTKKPVKRKKGFDKEVSEKKPAKKKVIKKTVVKKEEKKERPKAVKKSVKKTIKKTVKKPIKKKTVKKSTKK